VAGQGRVGGLFSTDRRFRHHIRLNYGHPRPEQLEPALKTVGRLAARLGKAV
jgi:DNA-binding transcriptional MocR family regulator